ncbi:23S rRNA (uracil(1939)-C(5))-methyltransferase RlmD [Oceanotoga teriensis]|uniref:23S rRNA (uracil(1939)-C(5))-methyltransferase RlmD n=1 Tax=Oceanotoga teriensis TaxID=515440 RepID=UPI0027140326|nr:23S rRNA (uracil(1939)-C(5))-methyltransferase RlmD [Oceanotoga teriensis]MDO7977621.1 23S rRNA (uracil(1939)-C(5))-methyltransferase RlmD [Oceanotoga teriensis]
MSIQLIPEKIVYGGYALAKYDNEVYLIENALPGELIEIEVYNKKKSVNFSKVTKIIEPSKDRVKSVCPHFNKCGGCDLLNYRYEKQIEQKENILKEQLRRIGHLNIETEKFEKSFNNLNYRNKMEFTFSKDENNNIVLGLNEKKSHKIINIEKCYIAPDYFNTIRNTVKEVVKELDIPIYDPKKRKGVLKHLVIKKSSKTNKLMIIIVTHTETLPKSRELKHLLLQKLNFDSLIHVMNSSDKVTLRGPYKTLFGEGILKENFDEFEYQIPPTSFFQINYDITEKILQYILEYIKTKNTSKDTLLDLYCGVGLFSLFYSPLFKHVTGVEYSKNSIKAAKSNLNINSIKNINFIAEDSLQYINQSIEKQKTFDYIIIDPPRSGLGIKAAEKISKITKKTLIYISCDPSTLSRDLNILSQNGFKVDSIKGFDMFPNTHHIETCVLLSRKN